MPTPAPIATKSAKAAAFFEEVAKLMPYLYGRWLDEQKYEDIKDYKIPLEVPAKKHGVEITQMHKRPFGCTFKVDGKTYQLKATSTSCGYKRIA